MSIRLRAAPHSNADDDRSLLAAFARTGDQAAFAKLVDRHGPLVLGVCRRMLRDPHLADDAFQAAFLILARKAASLNIGPSLAIYLFSVARRVAANARRGERRRTTGIEKVAQQPGPNAPRSADWDDLLLVLDEELTRLPDRLRAPVIECFLREKTQDEAAKELGWSVSTLRRRLDRAKELLRARMTGRGATLGAALMAGTFAASTAMASVPPALAQGAVEVALATKLGVEVPPSVAALAKGGLGAKVALSTLVIGVVAVGVGVELWPATPQAAVPTATRPTQKTTGPEEVPPPRLVELPKGLDLIRPREEIPAPRVVQAPKQNDPNWATIRGRVVWPKGTTYTPRKIDVTADQEHCLSQGALLTEELIINPKNSGVKNVVVWLRPDTDDRRDSFPRDRIHPELAKAAPKHHVIDQPCCQFVPRIVAARAGDTLEVKNSSPVPHNVNYNSDTESFNVTIPSRASHQPNQPLVAQATPILFKCDIHSWMQGRLRVFDHPYFAVTDDDGNFEIKNAPVGRWRVVVWHEGGFHRGREGVLGFRAVVTFGGVEVPRVELQLPGR